MAFPRPAHTGGVLSHLPVGGRDAALSTGITSYAKNRVKVRLGTHPAPDRPLTCPPARTSRDTVPNHPGNTPPSPRTRATTSAITVMVLAGAIYIRMAIRETAPFRIPASPGSLPMCDAPGT